MVSRNHCLRGMETTLLISPTSTTRPNLGMTLQSVQVRHVKLLRICLRFQPFTKNLKSTCSPSISAFFFHRESVFKGPRQDLFFTFLISIMLHINFFSYICKMVIFFCDTVIYHCIVVLQSPCCHLPAGHSPSSSTSTPWTPARTRVLRARYRYADHLTAHLFR